MGERLSHHDQFWDIAEPFLASGRLVEGTMMGHPCLREPAGNGFVATVERSGGHLVVKLSKERVAELIEERRGEPFAPAGKVFREWVLLPRLDDEAAAQLIEESIEFVVGS